MFIKSLALIFTLLSSSLLAADSYAFDNAHTEIAFKISHWSVSKVRGTFDDFSGSLSYDAKKPETSAVEVTITASSINTRQGMRDKHLNGPDFFDTAKFAVATFRSTGVTVAKDGKTLDIAGDLTLRDVTKSVVLKTSISGPMVDGQGKTRIGFEGVVTISRKDFGIAWNKTNKTGSVMLGDDVEITVTGEAVKN